ncbi:hypothetical protein NGM44_02400 [Moraxella sp. FZFQ2102]|nr:hypothetical protein [Moraxella sp. FZFQ2102]USZ15266.1 hypothetical protein NGM44_02400 [Moraxella sp. FZFQ2102]
MKKLLTLTLALFTIGCATTQPITQVSQQTSQPVAPTAKPVKTHIMYYWVDPKSQAQDLMDIRGQFYWQKGCLYLVNQYGKYAAMFPEYPKEAVQWDEVNKILILTNKDKEPKQFVFKMGDGIVSNGQYYAYKNISWHTKTADDIKCILHQDGVVHIGTIDIEKYDMSDKQ